MAPRDPWQESLETLSRTANELQQLSLRLGRLAGLQDVLALSVPRAAEALDVSPRTVERLVADGELQVIRVGRSVRVTAESLRRYVARQTERQQAAEREVLRVAGRLNGRQP